MTTILDEFFDEEEDQIIPGPEEIEKELKKISQAKRLRDYYRKNTEKVKARNSKWYAKNGKEYHRNYKRKPKNQPES